MPTIFTHAVVAGALGQPFRSATTPGRLWVLGALSAILPDADVLAFALGLPYDHPLGHRGLTHSLPFAVVAGGLIGFAAFPGVRWNGVRARACLYLVLAIASHGALDALTNGGSGIAFFAPFSDERYFFPWRPVLVSPIGLRRFLSSRGAQVLASELVWIWLPALIASGAWAVRRSRRRPRPAMEATR